MLEIHKRQNNNTEKNLVKKSCEKNSFGFLFSVKIIMVEFNK
jgi:hypothetical protein